MSFIGQYSCLGAVLVTFVTSVAAYHFDVKNIIFYEDPARSGSRGSYFGYTVALWSPGKKTLNESWMFIGAPRANSTLNNATVEPGTVFKCQIGAPCREWKIDYGDSREPTNGAWLGGAMSIENKTNPEIMVCAPKRMNLTYFESSAKISRGAMRGICYLAKASSSPHSQNIIQNRLFKNNPFDESKGRFQEVGFAVHINPNSSTSEFILGCPQPTHPAYGVPIYFNRSGIVRDRFTIPSSSNNNPKMVNDYAGYAVTSGRYFDARKRMYAIGAPRKASLNGGVAIFDFPDESNKPIKIYREETGDHIGEYFGAALASCDIDGDRKDDLLVGAPQWTRVLDEGRVYIFRGSSITEDYSYEFKTRNQIDGTTPRGRFGSTITCLGDTDYDGYADVAVGAPYDGNGAVYIFHGSKNGLTSNPQKIAGPKATRGFGISISEPRDVDNNGYADIAVGAHLSGHVTLIRSKRVVTMTVDMTPNFIGEQLDFEAESFSVSVCSTYGGPHAPKALSVTKEFKIDAMHERAKIEAEGKNWTTYQFSETLKSDTPKLCRNFTIVIVKTVNFDYLNPLNLSVSQRLNTTEENSELVVRSYNVTGDDNFNTSDAVTNKADQAGVVSPLYIPFKLNCSNNICRSNLSIEMTTNLENSTRYVIGSTPAHLRLDVKVNNFGDSAYSATAYINIPIYIGILNMPPTCTRYSRIHIICKVGNPLAKNELKTFSMNLDMSKTPSDIEEIKFRAIANTTSQDAATGGHRFNLSIDGVVKADIGITGKTNMDWHSYMRPQKDKRLPNIMFNHIYTIRNYEVTPLSEALLRISFPTHWAHADEEIEIAKLNRTLGNLDGKEFDCQSAKESSNIHSLSYDATTMPEWLFGENSSKIMPQFEKKFTIVDGKVFGASADDRTLHINATNPSVRWGTIDCIIGPFKTARSAASVVLTFDLLLSNLPSEIMQDKDIIFFATNGSTTITKPPSFIETVNNKPDVIMVGTMIIGSAPERQVAPWVIALAIFVGLLLLIIAVFALFKFGFFHRSKKAKLEALMKQSGTVVPRVTIETSSSTEVLDVT